jgi:transposase
MYDIETKAKELSATDRADLRQREAVPLLQSLGEWLKRLASDVLPKSQLAQAVTYVRNQWAALNVYVTDGDLAIDNNAAERALRGIAVGRKNWLFFASEVGGRTAAILTSFTATCQRHQINPWLYLKDVLTRIPTCPTDQLPTLLPDQWAAAQRTASA